MCVTTLNGIHFETEGVMFSMLKSNSWQGLNNFFCQIWTKIKWGLISKSIICSKTKSIFVSM
jgi:hypothetical protein